jgi:DNA-binding NtrC family response regulator
LRIYFGFETAHAGFMAKLLGYRVLVVEDEMLIAMTIEDTLANEGCEVIGPVNCIDTALIAVESNGFDGALLDLNLRGVASSPVAEALTARGIPFILLTGSAELTLPSEFRDSPFCSKPFTSEKLIEMVARHFKIA